MLIQHFPRNHVQDLPSVAIGMAGWTTSSHHPSQICTWFAPPSVRSTSRRQMSRSAKSKGPASKRPRWCWFNGWLVEIHTANMVKNSLDMSWPIVTKHKRSKVWKDKICTMVEHVMGMYMESDRPNIITDSLQLIDRWYPYWFGDDHHLLLHDGRPRHSGNFTLEMLQ